MQLKAYRLTYPPYKFANKQIKSVYSLFRIAILSIIFLGRIHQLEAQDLHYSQYFNAPLNLNPALTAFSPSNHRIILNNRNQWASVTVPYKTFSASYDTKLINRKKKGDFIGLGVLFNKDEAGDSKYGTTQAGLSLSWVKALNGRKNNILSLGIQGSYFQRSIDYSQLYFPDQWNGNSSSINTPHNEIFTVNQFFFYDLSAGAHWFWTTSARFNLNTGISASHLNRPNQSLMNEKSANLDIKYQFYSEAEIELSRPYDLLPSIYYAKQGIYQELLFGIRLHYKVHQNKGNYFALSTGLFGRNKDAMVIYVGMDYRTVKIAATYDFNMSSLSIASQYMGGMELSIQWLISNRKTSRKIKPPPCPIF